MNVPPEKLVVLIVDTENVYKRLPEGLFEKIDWKAFAESLLKDDEKILKGEFYIGKVRLEEIMNTKDSFGAIEKTLAGTGYTVQAVGSLDNGGEVGVDEKIFLEIIKHLTNDECNVVKLFSGDADFVPTIKFSPADKRVDFIIFGKTSSEHWIVKKSDDQHTVTAISVDYISKFIKK